MSCIFCDIAAGKAAAAMVADEPEVAAFLDQKPLFRGHVLIVPKRHIVTLDELPTELIAPLFGAVQRIMRAVVAATGAAGTFVANNNVVSQSVAHLHVHVVPRTKGDGLRGFFWPRQTYADDATMQEMAAAIKANLAPRLP